MFFKAPKQANIYDYCEQIRYIISNVIPYDIPEERYVSYFQNVLQFKPFFGKNINLSVDVVNDVDSQYDIKVKSGYVLMDYVLIEQKEDITLTVDKQYVIDNDYYAIIFAAYHFPIDVPNPLVGTYQYQVGLVLFDPSTKNLVPLTEYENQAYYLFTGSSNKLYLKFYQFRYVSGKYIEIDDTTELTFASGDTISTVPDDVSDFIKILFNVHLWDFGYYT